jgi:low temperature requirement protein LtrA
VVPGRRKTRDASAVGATALTGVLRRHVPGEALPVSHVELFFDLVYVFAVTQLSHTLHEHLTARGAIETLVLFLAVWWAWNYTAWATNWIDPENVAVRLLMVGLMLISLVMSAAIPEAFDGRALVFALAYVGLQAVRSAFMVAAFAGDRMGRNYAQLLAWSCIAGVAWIAGAAVEGDARLALWIVAVLVDYAAPWHGFALPRLGRTATSDWTLAGAHLAERNQLVLLIALGESILAIGVTFAGLSWTAPVVGAFLVGFLATAAFWWIYFGRAEEAARTIASAADPTRVGRAGYAYAHGIMVAGVIVLAVAIDLTIADPTASSWGRATVVILGGPILYLAGNLLFKWSLVGYFPTSRLAGLGGLVLLIPLAATLNRLALATAAALVVVVLAAATPLTSGDAT